MKYIPFLLVIVLAGCKAYPVLGPEQKYSVPFFVVGRVDSVYSASNGQDILLIHPIYASTIKVEDPRRDTSSFQSRVVSVSYSSYIIVLQKRLMMTKTSSGKLYMKKIHPKALIKTISVFEIDPLLSEKNKIVAKMLVNPSLVTLYRP